MRDASLFFHPRDRENSTERFKMRARWYIASMIIIHITYPWIVTESLHILKSTYKWKSASSESWVIYFKEKFSATQKSKLDIFKITTGPIVLSAIALYRLCQETVATIIILQSYSNIASFSAKLCFNRLHYT